MRDVKVGGINTADEFARPAKPLGALAWSALILSLLSLPSLMPYGWLDPVGALMLMRVGVIALILSVIATVRRSRPRGVALAALVISGLFVLVVVLAAGPLGFLRLLVAF
ncbi:hypothetical protein KZC52_08875 [Microbacterium sp. kSW2-24]|uniref:hypothetical protein n=1 Tax=Microbacterium galbinum TaxID=2851646 RepID=UPI001FFC78E4|nr:hypothetical protein [Microbacterium galbinum]MCK2023033.1 hypothetical protein [Microbacterium galbinum]